MTKPGDNFRTPREFYRRLDREFGFGLDAASSNDNAMGPHLMGDAISIDWSAPSSGRAVFCNPPYSELPRWARKCWRESRRVIVVMLVPAATSTRWWTIVRHHATQVRFVTGRLSFRAGDRGLASSAPFGSAVVVFTPAGGPPGYVYMPAHPPQGGELGL